MVKTIDEFVDSEGHISGLMVFIVALFLVIASFSILSYMTTQPNDSSGNSGALYSAQSNAFTIPIILIVLVVIVYLVIVFYHYVFKKNSTTRKSSSRSRKVKKRR